MPSNGLNYCYSFTQSSTDDKAWVERTRISIQPIYNLYTTYIQLWWVYITPRVPAMGSLKNVSPFGLAVSQSVSQSVSQTDSQTVRQTVRHPDRQSDSQGTRCESETLLYK